MTSDTIRYIDEVIRPIADRLAGLMVAPKEIIETFLAKDLALDLGFPESFVTRAERLENADYSTITPVFVPNADNRTPITNIDVLVLLRVIRFFGASLDDDPDAKTLIRKVAVNPRIN